MGNIVGNEPCPECRQRGKDSKGDNLCKYDDGGKYCHACHYTVPANSTNQEKSYTTREEKMEDISLKFITDDEKQEIKDTTTTVDYRGIRAETSKYFGVRFTVDEKGQPIEMYYPTTRKGTHVGYKVRKHPKTFLSPVGYVGKDCDMGGAFRFKTSKWDCLIVGGEIDQLSAFQMLRDSQINRGKENYDPIAVVTSVVGESGTFQQAKNNYSFFSQFKRIVVCMDNDDAGKEATEKLIKALPKGKVYLMRMTNKDPNEYLTKGQESKFVNDFYSMEQYVPAGIIASNSLYDKILECVAVPKIPLPPFLHEVTKLFAGGIPLGYITNWGGESGGGKTTIVNEILYYLIFNSPHRVGVVSMELAAGQYGQAILSRHIGQKIALIEDPDDAVLFMQQQRVQDAAKELFEDEFGVPRFHLVDDRDGSTEALQSVIEELIISCGCKVIVLDPLSDLLDGMTNDQQAVFMRWQKGQVKSHGVSFINICHVRKSSSGNGTDDEKTRFITEEDFSGSSTIFKSAGANVLMQRNKYHNDPIKKNTTRLFVSKNRWAGNTGQAGALYYDNSTHTLHDYATYHGTSPDSEF